MSNIITAAPSPLTGTITANQDGVNYIFIKAEVWDGRFTSLSVKCVKLKKNVLPTPTPEPNYLKYNLDLAEADRVEGEGTYNVETESIAINDSGDTVWFFTLPKTVQTGEKVKIDIKGTWTGTLGFRFWIGDGLNCLSKEVKKFSNMEIGAFDESFILEATGTCEYLTLKNIPIWNNGGPIDGLIIESISVEYIDEIQPE